MTPASGRANIARRAGKRPIGVPFRLATALTAALLLGACSGQDTVIDVPDDDPEMVAAIAHAREALPQFWEVFDQRQRGESGFALKVKITDGNGTEHFWATDIERKDGTIHGTINNDPNVVASVKLGDRIEIPEADISDWMYMRDGKFVGNRTLVPLLKSLPEEEAAAYRSRMAEP